ncbi:hypothetical protein B0T10DRAFT_580519, partial [Thelonectria olida]
QDCSPSFIYPFQHVLTCQLVESTDISTHFSHPANMGVTKTAAGVTAICAAAVPLDPTGLSLVASALGVTVVSVAGTVKFAKKQIDSAHKRTQGRIKESKLTDDDVEVYRDCIWKITSASVGVSAQGPMAAVMPTATVGLLISATVLYFEGKKLKKLKQKAGGNRALIKSISKTDIVSQIVGAAATKAVLLVLLVGHDEFKVAAEGLNALAEDLGCIKGITIDNAAVTSVVREIVEAHRDMAEGSPVEVTTKLAAILPDLAKEYLGVNDTPVWNDGTPYYKSFAIGVAAEGSEVVGKRLVEDPAQRSMKK